jgi:hypothetical protein
MSETTGMPTGLCQTCGADPRGGWGSGQIRKGDVAAGTCPDCGRSLTGPFARARVDEGAPAVVYELDDWSAEDRAAVAEELIARAVPFTWEPGLVLAVAEHREADADRVFDELDAAALEETGDGNDELLPVAEDGWGEGEDAFTALGDLFDAADRLAHTPTGTVAASDLRAASAIVRSSEPPFGFSPELWRKAGELASSIERQLDEGGSDQDVRSGAEALRDAVREHI